MKKTVIASLIVVMVVGIGVIFAQEEDKGNGAPSGPHYNLNILGKSKAKADIGCGDGHRIFVPLEGTASGKLPVKIMLTESPDDVTFEVLDCDGTDGTASFMLPNPDPEDGSPCTAYSVYIRALGKPGGKAKITTCAEQCVEIDPATGDCEVWEEVCSVESVELERTKGRQRFVNVSKELLTICALICTDYDDITGECSVWEWKRVYLFDPLLQNYFWQYDNDGLKLAQLRFYLEPTCYGPDEWACPPVE